MFLAFLNLGPSEVILVLLLLLVFFGVDKLPQLARGLGRFRGEMEKARRQFEQAVEDEESRLLREQLAFERLREQQMKSQAAVPLAEDETSLQNAAAALGLPTEGKTADELRRAIAERVGRA